MGDLRHRCGRRNDNDRSFAGSDSPDQIYEDSRKPKLRPRELAATAVMCSLMNDILHSKTCDLMYSCCCTWLFAGGWMNCNVHRMPPNPRCPWCQPWFALGPWFHLWQVQRAPDQDGLVVLSMLLAFAHALQRGWGRCAAWLCAATAYFGASFALGLAYKALLGYPYFLGFGERPPCNLAGAEEQAAPPHHPPHLYVLSLMLGVAGTILWASCLALVLRAPMRQIRSLVAQDISAGEAPPLESELIGISDSHAEPVG